MKAFSLALMLVLVVLCAPAWSMDSTLHTDFEGVFEADGVATGWHAYNIGSSNPTMSRETGVFHGGAASQKVDAAGVEGGVKAEFDAVPGTSYTVSVYVYEEAGGGGAYLQVQGDGRDDPDPGGSWAATGGPSWNLLTQTVTATGPTITVFLDAYAGVCYFDDVKVVGSTYEFEGGFQANGIQNDWQDLATLDPFFTTPGTYPDPNVKHSGAWAQKIVAYYEGGIYRNIPTIPGRTYTVSLWANIEAGQVWAAIPLNNWVEITGTGWQKYTWTGVADSTSLTLELDGYGVFWFDEVKVVEAPLEVPLPESPHYRIYNQVSELEGGGNIYYAGGVFDGKLYTGQNSVCAQLWGDEQVDVPAQTYDYWNGIEWVPAPPTVTFSARVNMTQPWMPVGLYGPNQWGRPIAKCSIPLGGWIYIGGGGTGMFRTASWWTGTYQTPVTTVATPGDKIPESICTDGQYIYATTWTPGIVNNENKIYKYIPDHVLGVVADAPGWPITIAEATGFSGISYYAGKIYAVDSGSPYGIYEIDAGTGAATKIANFHYPNASGADTQVARYGNQLFIVCANVDCHKIYTYTLTGGVWTATSSYLVTRDGMGYEPLDLYGIGVKGDGTTAQYAWVTAEGKDMYYFGLVDPWTSNPSDLRTVGFKGGHRAHVGDAVVTATNGSDRFWIENRARTTAAQVTWYGAMPALGSAVIVKGSAGRTASGERSIEATEMTEAPEPDPAAIKPFIMGTKSLKTVSEGLPTDGLLVKVCGKVSYYDAGTGAFYVDDGAGIANDLPGVKGVKVLRADGMPMSTVPNWSLVTAGSTCYAAVTGVVRIEKQWDGTISRRIEAREDSDIVIVAP